MPRVSALMPVCNDERHVGAAIHSLLRQTLSDLEVIVIDDGSTDRTCDIVRDWAARDGRVKLLRLPRPIGLAASLNYGMGACRAPLVAYCPADARSEPLRLERQAAWLAERPFTAMVGAHARVTDEAGLTVGTLAPPADDEAIRSALTSPAAVVAASLLWRRRDVEAVGMLATDAEVAGAELYELAVRIASRHRVENIPETLCVVRQATPNARQAEAAARAVKHVSALARRLLSSAPAPLTADAAAVPAAPGPALQARPRPRGRIFVAVAAYRDPELAPTLADLFARASYPDDVSVGVCLQYDPAVDEGRCTSVPTRQDQVQVVHSHRSESLGLGWARNVAERLWRGEEYVLQIDAHMRFADAWDERLLDQLARCDSAFPVLTTYPCRYVPPRQIKETAPPRLTARHFTDEGLLLLAATADRPVPNPAPTAFFAGGFACYPGQMLREVPSDPFMYFNATEPTHMVRAWTHGWDLFAPSENLVYHLYSVDKVRTSANWHDRPDWARLASRGQKRTRHLLGMEPTLDADALVGLDTFGLGRARTLEDYQRFAGIDFRTRRVSDQARAGLVNPRHVRPRRG